MKMTWWPESKMVQAAIVAGVFAVVVKLMDLQSNTANPGGSLAANVTTSQDTTVLQDAWVSIPGSVPILKGQASLQLELANDNQADAPSFLFLTISATPPISWVGYKDHTMQMSVGSRRLFIWKEYKYAVNIMAVESNRAKCAVFRIEE